MRLPESLFRSRPTASRLFLACLALTLHAAPSHALRQLERITGLDQSFVAGYTLREEGETAHGDQVLEFVQDGESAIYAEGEEKEQEEDLWFYIRKLDGGVLLNTNDKSLPHDPVSDLTYTFIPTLIASRSSQNTSIQLGYKAVVTRKAQDDEASAVHHQIFGELGYHFEKFNINLSESFSPRTVLAQGERTDLATDKSSEGSLFAFTNDLELLFDYTLSERTKASFAYKNHTLYFPPRAGIASANSQLSEMTHSYSPRLAYQVTPKVAVFGEYTREIKDFFKGGDLNSRAYTVTVGTEARVWQKNAIRLSGGYFSRNYQNFGRPDSTGGIYRFSISRPLTQKITASFFASKEIGENFSETTSPSLKTETEVLGVNVTYAFLPHTTIIGSANASFLDKGGQLTQSDPENSTRTLTRPDIKESYLLGAGLNWAPRRSFSAFVGYDLQNKKAAFLTNESTNHRFGVTATYVF